MKYFITLSAGKDSEDTVYWAVNNLPFEDWEIVFNDTDWDAKATYDHLKYIADRVGKTIIVVKNKGWADKIAPEVLAKIEAIFGGRNIFAELAVYKTRFPSTKARICTEELKVKPMIDFILDNVKEDCTIIQGVRAEESPSRRAMNESDEYFKFYFEPYGTDSKGRQKYYTYRKNDVIAHCDNFTVDVHRPIFKKTALEVFQDIFDNGSPAHPYYRIGCSRIGCWPCVNSKLGEIKIIAKEDPLRMEQLEQLEQLANSTFFPPGYIPERFCSKEAICMIYRSDLLKLFANKPKPKHKGQMTMFDSHISDPELILYNLYFKNDYIKVHLDEDGDEYILRTVKVPTIRDVLNYVNDNPDQIQAFDTGGGCVSVYGICEN